MKKVNVKMAKLLVSLTVPQKALLAAMRKDGYSASGFIRSLLEREFNQAPKAGRKGR